MSWLVPYIAVEQVMMLFMHFRPSLINLLGVMVFELRKGASISRFVGRSVDRSVGS